MAENDNDTPLFDPASLAVLAGAQNSAPPSNYVMAPDSNGSPAPMDSQSPSDYVNPAGPIVGMNGSPSLVSAGNPPGGPPNVGVKQTPLWQRVVMGALSGAANGAGGRNFGEGVALGAKAVNAEHQQMIENQQRQQQLDNQTQENQSNIKFRDAQAASMAIDAKMKDAQLQALPEQLRQQAEAHALSVMKEFGDMGLQPVLSVPDTGKDATTGLQQLTDSHGAVPSLFTVHAGGQIVAYNLNQLAEDPKGLDIVNQAGSAMNRPPINMPQWKMMPAGARTDLMKKSMDFFNPTPSEKDAGSQYQIYKNYLDTYSKNPNADPAIVARLQSATSMLGKVKQGLIDDDVNKEARKSGAAIQQQQTMADYKDKQKDSRTYGYAVDKNGDMQYTTKAAADASGMGSFEPQTPATIKADVHDQKVINDIAQKSNQVRDLLAKTSPTSLGPLAKVLNDKKLTDPDSIKSAISKMVYQGSLTTDAQDYANAVLQLREASMGVPKLLTGSARATEGQINALMQTLPGIESSSDVATRKLDLFTQNLDRMREGMPKQLPGITQIPTATQKAAFNPQTDFKPLGK